MSYVFSSSMPCFMLLVMLLFGLVFTVLNDTYIQRVHRRLILIIVALELVLIAQNAAEGDLVITLGCGDVYKLAKLLAKKLKEH